MKRHLAVVVAVLVGLVGLVGTGASARAAPAAAPEAVVAAVGKCGAHQRVRVPVVLRIRGLAAERGGWESLRLSVHNGTSGVCRRVTPVVVLAAERGELRVGEAALQWWHGRGWVPVVMRAELGALAGALGPGGGLTLGPGRTEVLRLRFRLGAAAPGGSWVAMGVALQPSRVGGRVSPWPVGVSDPYPFRRGAVASGR